MPAEKATVEAELRKQKAQKVEVAEDRCGEGDWSTAIEYFRDADGNTIVVDVHRWKREIDADAESHAALRALRHYQEPTS